MSFTFCGFSDVSFINCSLMSPSHINCNVLVTFVKLLDTAGLKVNFIFFELSVEYFLL